MVIMQTTLQISLTLHGRESSPPFLGTSKMKMPYLCSFNLIWSNARFIFENRNTDKTRIKVKSG